MKRFFNNHGSAMALAIFVVCITVFLVMGGLLLASSGQKATSNDANLQQAQQASTSGLEIAREQIVAQVASNINKNIPAKLIFNFSNDSYAEVNIDSSSFESEGLVYLHSVGVYKDIRKISKTTLVFDTGTSYSLTCDSLKLAGRYKEYRYFDFATFSFKSYFENEGKIKLGGDVSFVNWNNDLTEEESENIYWLEGLSPPPVFNSSDFLEDSNYRKKTWVPQDVSKIVKNFRQLGAKDPLWQHIRPQGQEGKKDYYLTINNAQEYKYYYIDIDSTKTVYVTIQKSNSGNTSNDLIVVSPANISVDIKNVLSTNKHPFRGLFLVSENNVDLNINVPTLSRTSYSNSVTYDLPIYVMSGKSIYLKSEPLILNLQGSLNAVDNVTTLILFYEALFSGVGDKQITLNSNQELIEDFPYKWTLLGIGKQN